MQSAPSVPEVVVASASRSTNSDSGVLVNWGGRVDIAAKLIVAAVTGNVVLTVEHADTAGGAYTAVDTFPAQSSTTTGVTRLVPGILKPFVRVSWAITTGPVTFSVTLATSPARMLIG